MASALIRAARGVSPVRSASASSVAGASASASNRPSSLAANRCFAAMKPAATVMIGSGEWRVMVSSGVGPEVSVRPQSGRPISRDTGNLGEGVPDLWDSPAPAGLASVTPWTRLLPVGPATRSCGLAGAADDWVGLCRAVGAVLVESVPFTRTCWHTVDPGTVLFTGSLNENVGCSGHVAGRARVRDRRRQQVVVPRPQRPPRGRDQHRHPRPAHAQRPPPLARRLRHRRRAARRVRRRRHATGAPSDCCATRARRGSPWPRSASSRR